MLAAARTAARQAARSSVAVRPVARRQLCSSSKSSSSSSSCSSASGSPLSWYLKLLDTNPLLTKGVTSFLIVGGGDILTQTILEDGKDGFDFKRLGIMSLLGGALVGPALHFWYNALFRMIPGTAVSNVLTRVAADQLLFAPPFVAMFMSSVLVLEGKSNKVVEVLTEEWQTAVVTNWYIWVPAQLINFRFVPLR